MKPDNTALHKFALVMVTGEHVTQIDGVYIGASFVQKVTAVIYADKLEELQRILWTLPNILDAVIYHRKPGKPWDTAL